MTKPAPSFCLACDAHLKNGRLDFCDKCLAGIERSKAVLRNAKYLDRANKQVR